MPKKEKYYNDFVVDRLTNSIVNCISGDSLLTDVSRLTRIDLKQISKKTGWTFDWKKELEIIENEVYKLTIRNSNSIVHGVVSISYKHDHVFINLIENAPFNQGKSKLFEGVAGNLVAFACQLSLQRGYQGNVSFLSKTKLINHYIDSLGAIHIGNHVMIINSFGANKLVEQYFKQ
jgi:hypothetical protein